jgi:quercetin dioxygenase-like cupin family protein
MEIEPFARAEWTPLPYEGSRNVMGKVLLVRPGLVIALLRFDRDATIHEHAAPHPIDVFCLEGSGVMSVGGEASPIEAGQRAVWPPDELHRLWTEASSMLTLMVEQPAQQ